MACKLTFKPYLTMKILNKETNQIKEWTMSEILTEINRDRSGDWIDYDETDWLEGWMFWVEENEDESCYKLLDKCQLLNT